MEMEKTENRGCDNCRVASHVGGGSMGMPAAVSVYIRMLGAACGYSHSDRIDHGYRIPEDTGVCGHNGSAHTPKKSVSASVSVEPAVPVPLPGLHRVCTGCGTQVQGALTLWTLQSVAQPRPRPPLALPRAMFPADLKQNYN
eukprot:scaffold17125_cov118-Isochrysis_galbana.AAC.2